MGTRGRKSAASQTVVAGNFGQRPEPPADLTDEQADVWRAVVASEASDFFGTAALKSLLKDYCRHTVSVGHISEQIAAFDMAWLAEDDGLKRYDTLLKIRDRETKAAADKATKLRLTNQSRYTPRAANSAAAHAGAAIKPWTVSA